MFAFAIWDDRAEEIFLVRDRFGMKPLYIYEDGKRFVFSSELKGILSLPDIDGAIDPFGVQDYLTFRYVQAPYTLFKNIRKLDAGTYLRIGKNLAGIMSSAQYRYWELDYKETSPPQDIEESKEILSKLLEDSVKSQLMGEVPIGVLLSGGLDSSAIAYYVHSLGADLTTYNIGFPEVNEFEFSREVAKAYGLKHREITVTTQDHLSRFQEVVWALDEPIGDPACFPLYRLCEELKKDVTVVLSGEGGDELFSGYPQYKATAGLDTPHRERFMPFLERSYYYMDALKYLKRNDIAPQHLRHQKYFNGLPVINGMLSYDMRTWFPENLMMKADKILMAHSLEGRFPFLDNKLFDFAARLPTDYKLRKGNNPDGSGYISKWILKEVMVPKLPETIIHRPKMGFTVPVPEMLRTLKSQVLETIESKTLANSALGEVVDFSSIKDLANDFYNGNDGNALQVWTHFILAAWYSEAVSSYKNHLVVDQRQENIVTSKLRISDDKVKSSSRAMNL